MNRLKRTKSKIYDELCSSFTQKYYPAIYRYCLYRLQFNKEAAEDCCHNTFLLFYSKIESFHDFANIKSWLYKTSENLINRNNSDTVRLNRKVISIDSIESNMEISDTGSEIEISIDRKINVEKYIQPILDSLSLSEKQLYSLYFREHVPIKELSALLDITETAVTTRIYRLKKKIKDVIHIIMKTESFL